ncbi:hypothetical protein T08_6044 [Trichinella sp. T8]|nr:hypothetical protein T08_6044 [Trichinella sp. T8]
MKFSGLSLQRSVGCRLRCGLSQQLLLACSNKRFSRLRGCHFSSVFSISSRKRKGDIEKTTEIVATMKIVPRQRRTLQPQTFFLNMEPQSWLAMLEDICD